jgi:hypothetical protein
MFSRHWLNVFLVPLQKGLGHHRIKMLHCLIVDCDSIFGLGFSIIMKDSL